MLTTEKLHFQVRQVEFLGRTISPEGISPQAQKFQNFRGKHRFLKLKKELHRDLGFVNFYRNYIQRMAEKPNPFYKLLKMEVPINNTENYVCSWISVKSTVCLPMTILIIIMQLALCHTQHNVWQGSQYSAN